jgi:hypothetical protein
MACRGNANLSFVVSFIGHHGTALERAAPQPTTDDPRGFSPLADHDQREAPPQLNPCEFCVVTLTVEPVMKLLALPSSDGRKGRESAADDQQERTAAELLVDERETVTRGDADNWNRRPGGVCGAPHRTLAFAGRRLQQSTPAQ